MVAAADLQFAAVLVVQMDEIVGLQQHVAELGVADAGVGAFQAAFYRVLGQHHVDREVLADVAQEIEIAEPAHPVEVVDQQRACGRPFEIEKQPHLFDAGDVARRVSTSKLRNLLLSHFDIRGQHLDREQIALFALAAGIADHAGGAADQRDWPMSGLLKSSQDHQGIRLPTCRLSAVGSKPRTACAARRASHAGSLASSVVW